MSFVNPSGSYDNESHGGPVTVAAPSTGATIAMSVYDRALYINNGSTLAALTVNLPIVGAGQKVEISFKGTITSLTVQDYYGAAITGSPTAGAAGAAVTMRYINKTVGWVKWR